MDLLWIELYIWIYVSLEQANVFFFKRIHFFNLPSYKVLHSNFLQEFATFLRVLGCYPMDSFP